LKNQNLPNTTLKKATISVGIKPRFFRYSPTADTGYVRSQHIWSAWRKPSANIV